MPTTVKLIRDPSVENCVVGKSRGHLFYRHVEPCSNLKIASFRLMQVNFLVEMPRNFDFGLGSYDFHVQSGC